MELPRSSYKTSSKEQGQPYSKEMKFYKKLDNGGGGRIVRCYYTAVTKSHNNLVLEKGICTLNELVHIGLYG
jgi:hypothetical protein